MDKGTVSRGAARSAGRLPAELVSEPLFVGATRPPMRWGVTYSALLCNLLFTLEAFLVTHDTSIWCSSGRARGFRDCLPTGVGGAAAVTARSLWIRHAPRVGAGVMP